ncbi:hypothetical protein CPB86DRAFT_315518 [Serendipita vermifera]|nr:hypothetical protein CPB86DRAFT_315518 [Serendipita vermifera]
MAQTVFEKYGGLVRFILYCAFFLWSFLLFIFCIVRLSYTTRWRGEPSLNGGAPFYDPCVVELLVSSILGGGFAILMLLFLYNRNKSDPLTKIWFEVVCLALLWLLWLGGAAAASTVWPDLSWCIRYSPCVILQVLMAWAWLGWITLTLLFFPTIFLAFRNRSWQHDHHDVWGHRTFNSGKGINMDNMFKSEDAPPSVPSKTGLERGKGRAEA